MRLRSNEMKRDNWIKKLKTNIKPEQISLNKRVSHLEYLILFSILSYICIQTVKQKIFVNPNTNIILLILFLAFGLTAAIYLGRIGGTAAENVIYNLLKKHINKPYFKWIVTAIVVIVAALAITYLNNWTWKEFVGQLIFAALIAYLTNKRKETNS